jgi:tRNA pseudouridine55 synthase
VFAELPAIRLGEAQTRMYRSGVKLDLERVRGIVPRVDTYRVYGSDGTFIGTAVTDREDGVLRVGKNLG